MTGTRTAGQAWNASRQSHNTTGPQRGDKRYVPVPSPNRVSSYAQKLMKRKKKNTKRLQKGIVKSSGRPQGSKTRNGKVKYPQKQIQWVCRFGAEGATQKPREKEPLRIQRMKKKKGDRREATGPGPKTGAFTYEKGSLLSLIIGKIRGRDIEKAERQPDPTAERQLSHSISGPDDRVRVGGGPAGDRSNQRGYLSLAGA